MKKLLPLCVLIWAINWANAQWITNGPHCSIVTSLAVNGSGIFQGNSTSGIYFSADDGTTWQAVNAGLGDSGIWALAVNGSSVYAGTALNGIYVSNNNGASWTDISTGLPEYEQINAIAFNGSYMFAAVDFDGVYVSSNNGATWTEANNGLSNPNVYSLAVSGNNIFAGTYGNGVYLSTDNGANWTEVSTGLTSNYSLAVNSFLVNGSEVYACTNGGAYLYNSGDESWSGLSESGLVVSGYTDTDVTAMAIKGSDIFIGTTAGMFLSNDAGQSWTPVNTGLPMTSMYALAVRDTDIFVGTMGGGVYISSNNGGNWTNCTTGPIGTPVNAVAACGPDIFAGTNGGGVYISADNGNTWHPANNGILFSNVTSFLVSGSEIYAGVAGGLFKSGDLGNTWMESDNGMPQEPFVYALASSGSNMYAGTINGVYLSTNNGASWTAVNTGLTTLDVSSLAISGDNIYAGTTTGVFLSSNNGGNWTAVNTGLPGDRILCMAASDTGVFAGTYGGGMFLTTDNGGHWVGLDSVQLRGQAVVFSLVAHDSYLFAGAGGLLVSPDNGRTWAYHDTGFVNVTPTGVAFGYSNVFVSNYSGGVWQRSSAEWVNCPAPAAPAVTGQVVCAGSSASLTGAGNGVLSWYTDSIGGVLLQVGDTFTTTTVDTTITYYVQDSTCATSQRTPVTVTVNPKPAPVVTSNGDTLNTGSYASYQWLRDGTAIAHAVGEVYIAQESGTYQVVVTNGYGCTDTSAGLTLALTGSPVVGVLNNVSIFPNPSSGAWQLAVSNELIGSDLEIFDDESRIVFQSAIRHPKSAIALTGLPSGVYYLRISSANASIVRKLVKL